MDNYENTMAEILRMFGLQGRSESSVENDDPWIVDLFDTRREGSVRREVCSPEHLDALTGEMDEFRLLCIGFIDEFTEYCTSPPAEWDKYMAINMRIWAEAVTNHIAIMMRWLPEVERKRIAKDFATILLAKSGTENFK